MAETKPDSPYVRACLGAKVPKFLIYDRKWQSAEPTLLKSTVSYAKDEYATLEVEEQQKFLTKLVKKPALFGRPYLVAVLGNVLREAASKVAFGMVTHAVQNQFRARVFRTHELRWDQNGGLDVGQNQYQVVMLQGVHTEDTPMRKQMVRDWVARYEDVFRIVHLYGDHPLENLYRLGLNPHAVVYYPGAIYRGSSPERYYL